MMLIYILNNLVLEFNLGNKKANLKATFLVESEKSNISSQNQ